MERDPNKLIENYIKRNQVAFLNADWDEVVAAYLKEFNSRNKGEVLAPSTWFRTVFFKGLDVIQNGTALKERA